VYFDFLWNLSQKFLIIVINEELRYLYSLPNIVRLVKLRRMRWAGHVARIGEGRVVHGVLVGRTEGKTIWENQT
jgi:hypothetical protein